MHIKIIYIILAILGFMVLSGSGSTERLDNLDSRLSKVEFFQEATRIRDNLIGFKQVNASLANNFERGKSCDESKDLLAEWSEDVKKLSLDYTEYMNINQEAKDYFDSISKLNDTIASDCNNFTSK